MGSVNARDFEAFVRTTRQRLLALERRQSTAGRTPPDFRGQPFTYFRVVKPIKPGESGLGHEVAFNTKVISDPLDPVEYEGWVDKSDAEIEIHDSAHKTLAMVGDIVVAEFRARMWRTFSEFGLANVRARVLEDVTPTGDPVVPEEVKYQILIGDDKTPQFYDGDPVYVSRMTTASATAGTEVLLSYDRTDRTWFIVETGGGVNWVMARVQEKVTHETETFSATVAKVICGQPFPVETEITVHNQFVGLIDPDHVGGIGGPYPLEGEEGSELIFILEKGMYVQCIQRDDGDWQAVQTGAVYNSSPTTGGEDPSDPSDPPPI